MTKREDTLFLQIKDGILSGQFGKTGDRFLALRDFAVRYACSLHCASAVFQRLSDCRILRRAGKLCYVTTGRCAPGSAYGTLLADTPRQVFGVLLNDNSNPFFGALTDRLQAVLRQRGAELISAGGSTPEQQRQALDLFVDLKCRGVFNCVSIPAAQQDFYRYYPLPMVSLAEDSSPVNIDSVVADNFAAGKQVAAHLYKSGCRRFAYISLDDYIMTDMRLQGFRRYLSSVHIPSEQQNVETVSASDEALRKRQVRKFLRDLLSNTTQFPLGIFCVHDLLAADVIRFIKHSTNKHLGVDVKVVGFDDLPIASLLSTPITTVSYPYSAMAEKAVEVMQSLLHSPQHIPSRYEIQSSLVVRESSQT